MWGVSAVAPSSMHCHLPVTVYAHVTVRAFAFCWI